MVVFFFVDYFLENWLKCTTKTVFCRNKVSSALFFLVSTGFQTRCEGRYLDSQSIGGIVGFWKTRVQLIIP